jgi:hypothetical protein
MVTVVVLSEMVEMSKRVEVLGRLFAWRDGSSKIESWRIALFSCGQTKGRVATGKGK